MEISTIAIIVATAFTVITIVSGSIRYFRAKKSKSDPSDYSDFRDLLIIPSEALNEFEPIKSHIAELRKAERCRDALHSAILKNLRDNGYVPTCKDPWRQASACSLELPDLLELQNIISLKPVIEVIEDQYKRFEEATYKADQEQEFTGHLILKVMRKLKMDTEMQNLVSSRGIYKSHSPNKALYELLGSPESKEVVERCIAEVLKGEG